MLKPGLELKVMGCHLGPSAISMIAEQLGEVSSLWATDNLIRAAGAVALAEALISDGSLTELHITNNQICDLDLDGFNFVNNTTNINLAAVTALAHMLEANATLKTLDVGGNRLGPQGMEILANGLFNNGTLTTLNVTDNRIGAELGASSLAALLTRNTTLTYVSAAASNDFADTGAMKLAAAIKSTTLCSLNLGGNPFSEADWTREPHIGPQGAVAILDACSSRKSSGLKVLDVNLRGNIEPERTCCTPS